MGPIFHSLLLICDKSWQSILALLPYVIVGVVAGELLKLTSWTKLAARGATRAPYLSIPAAAALGMASPLCTYGTVPVVIQLLRAGVPISPLAAFLATSAMMNPQLFIMTWGGLGHQMALVRGLCVLVFGIMLGLILRFIPERLVINPTASGHKGADGQLQPSDNEAAAARLQPSDGEAVAARLQPSDGEAVAVKLQPSDNKAEAARLQPPASEAAAAELQPSAPKTLPAQMQLLCQDELTAILLRKGKPINLRKLAADSLASLQFVGLYLIIGVVLGAAVEVYVPGYWLTFLFKPGSWVSILLACLLGVPLYACGGGVIPLVRSFLEEGMSRGAALAFLIVGPATRFTPLMALAAVLRLSFIVIYLVLLIAFSLASGLLYR